LLDPQRPRSKPSWNSPISAEARRSPGPTGKERVMSHAGRFLAVISLFDVTYVDPKDNPRNK
jgi:hypothetical protein